jgi:phosphomannomutase
MSEENTAIAEAEAFDFRMLIVWVKITENDAYMDIHIDEVLNLPLVDVAAVAESI